MKVGIIVVVYNLSSEIFMLQVAAIRKFCKDDFTILVVDNSTNLELAEHIRYHAEQLKVSYTKTFANSTGSSDSHTWACNFAYQKFKDKYNFLAFFDHDCIPVIPFSIVEILKGGHVMAGLGQGAKKKYMWAGMVMIAMDRVDKDLIDFGTNAEFGLDSGGNLYKTIEKFGEENCIFFNEAYHQNPYFNGKTYNHYAMLADNTFMHFVNSSLWNPVENNEGRINGLINVLKEKTGL